AWNSKTFFSCSPGSFRSSSDTSLKKMQISGSPVAVLRANARSNSSWNPVLPLPVSVPHRLHRQPIRRFALSTSALMRSCGLPAPGHRVFPPEKLDTPVGLPRKNRIYLSNYITQDLALFAKIARRGDENAIHRDLLF